MRRYIDTALGKQEFDLLFTHATMVDVYTDRIIEDVSIGVFEGIICAINPRQEKARQVIDCQGQYVIPGLMDPHVHIETSHLNPVEWSKLTIQNGTTAIFSDMMLMGNVYGERAIEMFRTLAEQVATRVYYNIPSKVPAYIDKETCGGNIDVKAIESLIDQEDVTGLGEVNALSVLVKDTRALEKIQTVLKSGKRVSGHCAKIADQDLNAVAVSGISDDHESLEYEEIKEKLMRGITVMIRDGSVESSIEAIVPRIVQENLPIDNLMFCTDDKNPLDISQNGHLNGTLRKAVNYGLAPEKAIKMVTLNVAKYFRKDDRLGSLAPGRYADMVFLDNLKDFEINKVYVGGNKVYDSSSAKSDSESDGVGKERASEKEKTIEKDIANIKEANHDYQAFYDSVLLQKDYQAQDFDCIYDKSQAKVRLIDIDPKTLLTKAEIVALAVDKGKISACPTRDILHLAVIERYGKNGNVAKGFMKGIGLKRGAVACTLAQESNNIITCGLETSDMAIAVNHLAQIGGGYVLVKDGIVICENPMRLGGIMYDTSYEESLVSIKKMQEGLKVLGCDNPNIFTYLAVGSAPSIPEIGITDYGLIDSRSEEILDLIVED